MTQSNTGGSPIKRYTLVRGGMDHQDMMCVRPDGKWVRHEDHAAEVLALRAGIKARDALLRAGCDLLALEAESLRQGISIGGVMQADPEDAATVEAITEIEDWIASVAATIQRRPATKDHPHD